ncbi:hypothetical protein [Planomonospora venezuelensis]|uniref:Uncharacterized protein n=1 Tax=Planomonospora venezuelensis TaxID=1999 RepID=A0A841DDF0_PLAVE|nr:hypothetical protein [Planomonospora venezuelensis]MBB5966454.1 hypothetical protein [Planomonospora venezuelensis]
MSLLTLTMGMPILDNALPDVAVEPHSTSDQRLRIVDVCSLVLAGSPVSLAAMPTAGARRDDAGCTVFGAASSTVVFTETAEAVDCTARTAWHGARTPALVRRHRPVKARRARDRRSTSEQAGPRIPGDAELRSSMRPRRC